MKKWDCTWNNPQVLLKQVDLHPSLHIQTDLKVNLFHRISSLEEGFKSFDLTIGAAVSITRFILKHDTLRFIFIPEPGSYSSLSLVHIHPWTWFVFIPEPGSYSSLNLVYVHPWTWIIFIPEPGSYSSLSLVHIHPWAWFIFIPEPGSYSYLNVVHIHP